LAHDLRLGAHKISRRAVLAASLCACALVWALAPEKAAARGPKQDGTARLGALRAELDSSSRGSAKWIAAALQYGRLAFHLRKFATAKRVLGEFLEASGDHPEAASVRETLDNIRSRFQLDRGAIGVLLPLSGKFGRYGREAKRGIDLALDESSGLRLVYRDTRGQPARARAAVRDLVVTHRVIALLGPIGEGESLAAAELAEQYQVPILTLTRREGITGLGPFVFRNFLTNKLQGQTMARYAMQVLGLRRFAILYPNTKYGEENMRAFWDEAVKLGGRITAAERYSPHDRNHSDPVRKLVGSYWLELRPDMFRGQRERGGSFRARKQRWERAMKNIKPIVDFDAVFIPDFSDRLVFVVPWLSYYDVEFFTENVVRLDRLKLKYRGKVPKMVWLLGTNGWNSDRLHKRIGDHVWRAVFCDAVFRFSDDPAWTTFVNKYKERYTRTPHFLPAIGYDSLRILHKAIVGTNAPTREAARDELRKIKDYPGATGTTSLNGTDVEKKLHVLSIERSKTDVNRYEIHPAKMDPREGAHPDEDDQPKAHDFGGDEGGVKGDADTAETLRKPRRPRRRRPAPIE
jgi:ABC-type branched-subunit amino acid transport system substrate-binding protein